MSQYTHEQLEKTLAPLHLPKAGEDRTAFEPELDARLASLAVLAELSAPECVGLALWLGKDGWKAFEVDVSDCTGNPTSVEFSRNLRMGATIYDEAGDLRHKTDPERAKAVRETMQATGKIPTAESTLRKDVNNYRRAHPPEQRSDELLALSNEDDNARPIWMVKKDRREQMQRELRWSAARLQSS